jgi:hypothetical protein
MTDLINIFEKRVLTNVRLTQHQMTVLAMILASPEGVAPDEDISKGPNLTTARKMLTKLGLITHDGDNKYSVSETGQKVAKDENLIDDTGQLTELGNEKAYADDSKGKSVGAGPGGPEDEPAEEPFAQTSNEIGMPGPSESFKFIGDLLNEDVVDLGARRQQKQADAHSRNMDDVAANIKQGIDDMQDRPKGNMSEETLKRMQHLDHYISSVVDTYMEQKYPDGWEPESDDDYQDGPIDQTKFFQNLSKDFKYRRLFDEVTKVLGSEDKAEHHAVLSFHDALESYH